MNYKKALFHVRAQYSERINRYRVRLQEALQENEALYALERDLRSLEFKQAQTGLSPAEEKRIADLKSKKAAGLSDLKIVPPLPACRKCGDTGRIGKRYCDCVLIAALRDDPDGVSIPLYDFSRFDASVFPAEKRADMVKLKNDLTKIATEYPVTRQRVLLLLGAAGTGKSFLAGCFANELLQRGESVIALSAFALNNRFLKYHTTFDDSKSNWLDPLLDCTLLVIDDLGTESILKNVTKEYLFNVINERNGAKKLTFITSNYDVNALQARYGERTVSRLLDKQLALVKTLGGYDLRSAL